MTMARTGIIGGTVFTAAVAVAATSAVDAADRDNPAFARRVAGTYFVVEQATGTKEFLTLQTDGNALLNSSAEDELRFSSSQGVWRRTGRRTIALTIANFDFDDFGIAVVDFVIAFNPTFTTFRGSFSGALYSDDVDPLDPQDEYLLLAFEDEVEGRRMVAR